MSNAIMHWGETMRLVRRAAMLATEYARKRGVITDPLDSSILIYTDDPTAAGWFFAEPDMAAICKTSAIEGVAIVMGEKFPPASFEAERMDDESPRVAAMFFPAPGSKCPRCRNFTLIEGDDVCQTCARNMREIEVDVYAVRWQSPP